MPVNQLERHPYLNYRDELKLDKAKKIKGLIIGSFPIYACTNVIDENLNVIQENNIENLIRFRFFYGSRKSKFWDYLFEMFGNENEITVIKCVDMLENNNLIVTDVLSQTNRINESSDDKDLLILNNGENNIVENLQMNHSIIDLLNNNLEIENLYFTAKGIVGKSPFGWFRSIFNDDITIQNIFRVNNAILSFNCFIKNRRFKVFMLPTPKPRGIHFSDNQRNQCFSNYIQCSDNNFYNQIDNLLVVDRTPEQKAILSQLRHNFIIETYRQAFIYGNMNFNGSLNN